jgi:hypothetical protein
MARTIRIDDEVWRQLQQRAQPLVDTPNDVLRRVFALDKPILSGSHTDIMERDIEVKNGKPLFKRTRKAKLHPPVKNENGTVIGHSIKAFADNHVPPIKYEGMRNAIDVLTACKSPNGKDYDFHYEIVKYVENDGIYVRRMMGPGHRTSNEEMRKLKS